MRVSGAARLAAAAVGTVLLVRAQVTLAGRVVDESDAPITNVRVSAHKALEPAIEAHTGPSGTFRISLPAPGTYLVSAARPGYFALADRAVRVDPEGADVTLVLSPQKDVFQSVTVGELPSPVDPAQTERQQRLSGTEINDIPYPASHSLRSAMKLIPGVVQDPSGGVHFHGGAEYQTEYLLDGFDISDPIDGRYSTRLAVESVRSLDLTSSRESPQFGRGSAGALAIRTENGGDSFHFTSTNFIPGIETKGGLRFGDWTPRGVFSGPIKKGRAWFSDSFDGEYNGGYISGLPKGQDSNPLWVAGNLVHAQVNVTPSNILYGDLLTNFAHQSHYGLGVLDPISTTTALSSHEWLAGVKDTQAWTDGTLVEAGFAEMRIERRRVPLGDALYVITPEGRTGNYFLDSREHGRRQEFFANFFPRALYAAGRHQIQIGADAQRLEYTANMRRTGYKVVGLSGLPLFRTTFQGAGDFAQPDNTVASYINDHWQPLERLALDLGLRQDWDDLVGQVTLSPRVSAAYSPFADAHTKIAGGYALLHDRTNLALFSRPLDQQSVTIPYSPSGAAGAPLTTTFVPGRDLKQPRYDKWSASVERDFGRGVWASVEWMRKRGADGFVYSAEGAPGTIRIQPLVLGYGFGGTYSLTNARRDRYDEVAVTVRRTMSEEYGWMASYVHSRAVSNAVLDVSVDQPLQLQNNFGPMPWDAPNRVLGWGYLPTFWKNWALAFLVDWRTGFPFSVANEAGVVTGAVNSRRFPSNFDLNVHIERRFVFAGYRFALRAGANNITAHRNPTAVNNVIGSPQFLQFFGDEGRHFVFRIRVFGRAGH